MKLPIILLLIILLLVAIQPASADKHDLKFWWAVYECGTVYNDGYYTSIHLVSHQLEIWLVLDRINVGYAVTDVYWHGQLAATYHNEVQVFFKNNGWQSEINKLYLDCTA